VNKGDKISIKQSLSRVRTNGDTGKTVIKFYYYRIPPTLITNGYPLNSNTVIKKSKKRMIRFSIISWLIIVAVVQHDLILSETQQIVL
jgi:hypothetical protein